MPGTLGKTPKDQDNIDDTVAGGCATKVFTQSECLRHQEAVRAANPVKAY